MALFPVLGKAPAGSRLQRIQQSPNYRDGHFHNLVPTEVTLKGTSLFKMLREYRNRPADTAPGKPVPIVRTDLRALPAEGAVVAWFGHSSYLLKINGLHILVDPVFSANASPVPFLARAFAGTSAYTAADMPELDVLLLTHDHYDHLDYHTILQLAPKTKRFCTSPGVGAHLESWGVAPDKIVELDWWESWGGGGDGRSVEPAGVGGGAGGSGVGAGVGSGSGGGEPALTFTATPARHFSGRTFKRGGTLWSSFVLKAGAYSLFLGGDSGYEQHFKQIGDRYGPFDLAILKCGQYGKNWPFIHMLPEQTVQAALDLRAAALLPVHWGKFTLALHPWNEPVRRVTAAAAEKGLPVATPLIGEPVFINGPYPDAHWWDFL